MPRTFNPSRGGHAPGYLRDALIEYVGNDGQDDGPIPIKKLVGLLWNCTDVVPREWAEELGVLQGSSYAQSVRHLARILEDPC